MSHTVQILLAGFIGLAVLILIFAIAKGRPAMRRGALLFIPLWFIAAAANMAVGVIKAGYSVAEEAPIFLVVFGIPAGVAFLLSKLLPRS